MSGAEIVQAAARGELPEWSVVRPHRRAHIARVVELLDRWSTELHLDGPERMRWRAVGWLHDALRDADASELRLHVPADLHDLPDLILHGPACAARLRSAGVTDEALLLAIGFHTLGHPDFDHMGRALYLADFLEAGRDFEPLWRATLRARMPAALDDVLIDVVQARIRHLIESGRRMRPETLAFWNSLVRV